MNSIWPNSVLQAQTAPSGDRSAEFERLWRGFMTARVALGLVLSVFQAGLFTLVPQQSGAPLVICGLYFAAALAVRLATHPQQMRRGLDAQWLRTVGIDVLSFALLQVMQGGAINYLPLFAMPVLMVSVLGSMMLAMATAASVTLLLFAHAAWLSTQPVGEAAAHFLQAALIGTGCFAMSFIANQLATRLASMEQRAKRNQLAAAVQRQVNELVIKSLTDGILVVDEAGSVRSVNPAAAVLLDIADPTPTRQLALPSRPEYQALTEVISASFFNQRPQQADISIGTPGRSARHLRVRTQLTASRPDDALGLCVVFMQDQREIQARIRSAKLAGMGRMSAAVAHEIRNPLAAITQANALLSEDLTDPAQQRLAQMVQQNAARLEIIVHDVLHLTHANEPGAPDAAQRVNLTESTQRVCRDWAQQNAVTTVLQWHLPAHPLQVWFDPEHLRRVLVNLLDNAYRYASRRSASVQVSVAPAPQATLPEAAVLRVWSDGAPLDASVEQHLFEPFFSSESRSSGLGLYICRELCESHGATISYDRSQRTLQEQPTAGNEFSVFFKSQPDHRQRQPTDPA